MIPSEKIARELDALFAAVGWQCRGVEKWLKILGNTEELFLERDGETLIGCARYITDGAMCVIFDVIVHPSYRRKGIGTRLINRIKESIADKKYIYIGLSATDEAIIFYESLGFARNNGMRLQ